MGKNGIEFLRTAKVCSGYPRWQRKDEVLSPNSESDRRIGVEALVELTDGDRYKNWAEKFWSAFHSDVGNFWLAIDVENDKAEDVVTKYAKVKTFVLSVFVKQVWMLDVVRKYSEYSFERMGAIWVARFAGVLFDAGILDDKSLVRFASCVLAGIKEARARYSGKKDNGVSNRRWQEQARHFVERFSKIVAQINDDGERLKWYRYVRHYEVVVCESETDLADAFSRGRLEYNNNRNDFEIRKSYAWVLHDCLNLAIQKYKKESLVKLFYSEMSALPQEGLPSEKKSDIGYWLPRDLKKADCFLSGTGAARSYEVGGEPEKAVAAYRDALAKDENNLVARIGLVRLGASIGDFVGVAGEFFLLLCQSKKFLEDQRGVVRVSASTVVSVVTTYLSKLVSSPENTKGLRFKLRPDERTPNGATRFYKGWHVFTGIFSICYIEFIKAMAEYLTTDDRYIKRLSNGKEQPSLCERVCRCLYQCAIVDDGVNGFPQIGDGKTRAVASRDVRFVVQFLEKELSCTEWLKDGLHMYGSVLLVVGEDEKARKVFVQVLQKNPASVSSWIGLGDSFPNDSVDFAACMCKALSLGAQGISAPRAHDELAKYYSAIGRLADSVRERNEADDVRKKHGWKKRNNVGGALFERLEGVEPVARDENEFKNLITRANLLVGIACNRVRGVIVLVNRRGRDVRVFWCEGVQADTGHYVFVKRELFGEIQIEAGLPVTLLVVSQGERVFVVGVEPRNDGVFWDVFPCEKGIVVNVDEIRGFTTLALRGGRCVVGPLEVMDTDSRVKIGQVYDLGLLRVESGDRVLFGHPVEGTSEWPDFVRKFSGRLVKKHRYCLFGRVGDVFVPKELCAELVSPKEVKGWAVQITPQNVHDARWRAVAVEKQLLEVESVLRS